MKKFTKLVCVLLCLTLCALGLTACGNKSDGGFVEGKVTDKQWKKILSSFDVENMQDITYYFVQDNSDDYIEGTDKLDFENQVLFRTNYEGDNPEYAYLKKYMFKLNEKFYSVSKSWAEGETEDSVRWDVSELSQEDFLFDFDAVKFSATSAFTTFVGLSSPATKNLYTYDADTKTYTYTEGEISQSIKFLSNGVEYVMTMDGMRVVIRFTDVNKTTVTIPDEILQLVNA